MNDMYQLIESLCKAKGKNVTEMCRETGISRSALSELKADRTKQLTNKYLPTVAAYCNVSVDYLLGNQEKPAAVLDDELNEYLEELKNREDMRMLFSLAKGATKEDVMQAVKIIEALRGD